LDLTVETLHPHTKADVAELLRAATADGTRILTVGGRTHVDRGNPSEVDAELWTTQMDGVVAYDPAEMIAVVESGMRVHALRTLLADGGQEWAVDAPDEATVGGVLAAGVSSSRRLRVGHVRESLLEVELVTGDGRLVRSGARTMKNATGYDLRRLSVGSLGTLGVLVQVALKVRPLARATRTLVALEGGLDAGRRLLGGVPLPAAVLAEPGRVVVRLEGWPDEVEAQTDAAREVVDVTVVEDAPFPEGLFPDAPIVAEAAVAPSRLDELLEGRDRWRACMGVGTAWVPVASADELAELRFRAAGLGGIAPVLRGPGGLGEAPLPAAEVARGLKARFDPAGVLAPGRGWGGI
jgi:glycolate oxidase FAD binding subunit